MKKWLLGMIIILGSMISLQVKADGQVSIFRLYNPNTGEHLYTANSNEWYSLAFGKGWENEGVAWFAPNEGAPVYRVYNPNTGDHHYTMNSFERDMLKTVGWRYEGISWYSDLNQQVPLYRVYNPNNFGAGSHHYTTNQYEQQQLVATGWKNEGVAWYGVAYTPRAKNETTLAYIAKLKGEYYKNGQTTPSLTIDDMYLYDRDLNTKVLITDIWQEGSELLIAWDDIYYAYCYGRVPIGSQALHYILVNDTDGPGLTIGSYSGVQYTRR